MYKKLIKYILITILTISSPFASSGLGIMVAGDIVYEQGFNPGSEADNKLKIRGAEVGLFSPIDHNFDGYMSIVAHDEGGETNVELHELIISSSKLIPRSNIRVGQFFLGVGRLNRFHQHDWPFIRAPKVHRLFFDDEGVFDTGIEYSYQIPTERSLRLTLGLTSGRRYGHAHSDGPVPQVPTHYTRLSTFFPFGSVSGIELGMNYLGRTDSLKNQYQLIGYDFTFKKRQGKVISYMLQSEGWFQKTKNSLNEVTEQTGLYLFNNFSYNQFIAFGFRLDAHKDFTLKNSLNDKKINNIHYGGTLQSSYTSSEFAKFTAALSHEFYREEGITLSRDTRFELQLTFILGSHPAHDF